MANRVAASASLLLLVTVLAPTAQAGDICINLENFPPFGHTCTHELVPPDELVDEIVERLLGLWPTYDPVQEIKDFLAGGCFEHPAGGHDAC